MNLVEPSPLKRGTFHAAYVVPKDQRGMNRKAPRLLDHLLAVAPSEDPEYMDPPGPCEFIVVDVVTREKAWFEYPDGVSPDVITGMVASTFNSAAFRVGEQIWFV